jgi:hypothetical protein
MAIAFFRVGIEGDRFVILMQLLLDQNYPQNH